MNIITVVAYRSDGADYCRSCLMSSWGSEFELNEFEELDQAASFIAAKRHEDKIKKPRTACDWELTILINGKSFDGPCELENFEEGCKNLLAGKVAVCIAKLEKEHQERLVRDEQLQKAREIHAQKQSEMKRRELFEALKKEFEG